MTDPNPTNRELRANDLKQEFEQDAEDAILALIQYITGEGIGEGEDNCVWRKVEQFARCARREYAERERVQTGTVQARLTVAEAE